MSSPAGTSQSHWIAQGVRHELLLRLLPSIRHDMLGPVSVARMGVAVLIKRLGNDPPNLAGALERAQELNQHMAQVTQQLREFRHWDPSQAGRIGLPAALSQCVGWLQPVLTLQGFELDLAPASQEDAGAPSGEPADEWQRDELMFLIAGLICHVLDCWAPCQLQIEAGPASLQLRAGASRPAPAAEHRHPLPTSRQILLPALAALADASQAVLTSGPGRLELQLARPDPA